VVTGTYRQLVGRVIYTEWIFFALLAIGVMVLRRRRDYHPRWRMPGVPIVPIAFALVSFAIVVNQVRVDPTNSAIGLGLVLIGWPIYWFALRRV
jgi:APA family basic amino acid/polyamine antiporter